MQSVPLAVSFWYHLLFKPFIGPVTAFLRCVDAIKLKEIFIMLFIKKKKMFQFKHLKCYHICSIWIKYWFIIFANNCVLLIFLLLFTFYTAAQLLWKTVNRNLCIFRKCTIIDMLCQLLCWIQCKTRILKEFQSHIKLTSLTIAVFTFQRSAMCLTFEGCIYILMSMISEPSDLKCLSFHCIWKWAVSFQCLLRSCFVCD